MSRGFKNDREFEEAAQTTYEVIFRGGIISLDVPVDTEGIITLKDFLVQPTASAEQLVILENEYEILSLEAKEVIELVLDPPPKIKTKSHTQKGVSKTKLSRFLRSEKKWPARKIERCYKELRNFTNGFME